MGQDDFLKRYTYNPSTDSLGSGGFGDVYRAYDNFLDREVAIKVSQVRPNTEAVRLRNEVEKATQLLHPNIAHYEECYTLTYPTGEYDFAVMQYYKNGSLDKLLMSGNLPLSDIKDILMQMLEGIAYLHQHNIIHRDLKPQNVLIARRNGRYIPKITDFGISKQLDQDDSSAVSNSILGGTRSYASPEQLKEASIRKNTDLWSFGIIAYQAFIGKLPFTSGSFSPTSEEGRQEQFRRMVSGNLPSEVHAIPQPWRRLIIECLTVNNEKRIAHAEDALNILSEVGEEIQMIEAETIFDISPITIIYNDPVVKEKQIILPKENLDHRYDIGDYYSANGKNGVIIDITPDGQHGKIISLDETKLQWCTQKQYNHCHMVGTNSISDGQYNTDVVMSLAEHNEYPAFVWCRNLGNDWYLPSIEEMVAVSSKVDIINKTLAAKGRPVIKDGWYWSSSEIKLTSDNILARLVTMNNGYVAFNRKYGLYSVRAMSTF